MTFDKEDKKYLEKLLEKNNQIIDLKNELHVDKAKDELQGEMKQLKSEILDHIDAFAGEIKTNREERIVQSEQISRNTKRINKIEGKIQFKGL